MTAVTDTRPDLFLHLGAAKTGTTYLQSLLWRNRDVLREAGMLYPGLSSDAHFRAATDLCGIRFGDHVDPLTDGAWARLIAPARAWGGPVVLSHELLSTASRDTVRSALRELSWARVHVVCAVRDLARQIPATWQEDVKNRHVLRFADYLTDLRTAPGPDVHPLASLFWSLQDVPAILRVWAEELPAERVHVVTVPPAGAPPHLLWSRFGQALGLDPGCLDSGVNSPVNASMGVAEVNLLRRLNLRLADELDWPSYDVLVKDHLGRSVLGARPGRALRLPRAELAWVTERAEMVVDQLSSAGYDVIGDLADLLPLSDRPEDEPQPPAPDPDAPGEAEMLDVAMDALVALLRLAGENSSPPGPAWRRTAVVLSRRHPGVRLLHQHYLTTKARMINRRPIRQRAPV